MHVFGLNRTAPEPKNGGKRNITLLSRLARAPTTRLKHANTTLEMQQNRHSDAAFATRSQDPVCGQCGYLSDNRSGLNGSTQHSSRTRLALKTEAKIAR